MKFKLFNATTMHNSTKNCKKKFKKSDLNQKNLIFSIFIKNHDFFSNHGDIIYYCVTEIVLDPSTCCKSIVTFCDILTSKLFTVF